MQRVHYFDLLNILACISVVALHCNGYTHTFAHDAPWKQAIFFETVFYSAVPIFFMLSGATLFNYRSRYTTAQFYKKRYTKTLIPYLVFGIGLYTLHFLKQSVSSGAAFDVNHFLSAMLTGQIPFANFWFFIPLFMVYLFIPFLERIVNQSSTKELFLLVSIVFFFSAIVPIVNYLGHWNITQATSIGGYCIYAILGYALTKTEVEKNNRIVFTLCFLTLALWGIRYAGLLNSTERTPLWFNYFGLYAVIPATTCFILAKRLDSWLACHEKLTQILTKLSSLSFGVYLTHGLALAALPFAKDSYAYRILGIPLVYLSCCAAVFIMQKIPLLRKVVP
jgi:surface polysaccharide O-acyltransferase-like enzyme